MALIWESMWYGGKTDSLSWVEMQEKTFFSTGISKHLFRKVDFGTMGKGGYGNNIKEL